MVKPDRKYRDFFHGGGENSSGESENENENMIDPKYMVKLNSKYRESEIMIDPKYIGHRFRIPLVTGCVQWLMLDRLQASGLICGIAWTIYAFIVLALAVAASSAKLVHPVEFMELRSRYLP